MTTQTKQTTANTVATAGDVAAFLTILAAIPYELGEAATYLPPNVKAWVAGVGVFATLALRLWKRWLERNQPIA